MYQIKNYDIGRYLSTGLLLSLFLHIAFVISLASQRAPRSTPAPLTIDAFIHPERSRPRRQIVSPSETKETKSPEKTNLLSDRDTSAVREQIKRGDGPLAGQNPGKRMTPSSSTPENSEKTLEQKQSIQKASKEPPAATQPVVQPKTERPLDLNFSSDYIKDLTRQSTRPPQKASTTPAASTVAKPFSRAPGSGAQFLGFNGNSDFLPNIRDGDITLLNAKADKYAVFVRRVAIRIFHLLKQYGWDYMRASDFHSLSRFTTIRAKLSPSGEFMSVSLEDTSGNRIFDDLVKRSIVEGVSDPNPPPGALSADGTFQFIFLARSWSQASGNPNGGLSERRWLSLQTGLE